MLEQRGYQEVAVRTGREAIEVCEQGRPDLKGRITPQEFEQRVMGLLARLVPNEEENLHGHDQMHSGH